LNGILETGLDLNPSFDKSIQTNTINVFRRLTTIAD
jgi:hypothetical protein